MKHGQAEINNLKQCENSGEKGKKGRKIMVLIFTLEIGPIYMMQYFRAKMLSIFREIKQGIIAMRRDHN